MNIIDEINNSCYEAKLCVIEAMINLSNKEKSMKSDHDIKIYAMLAASPVETNHIYVDPSEITDDLQYAIDDCQLTTEVESIKRMRIASDSGDIIPDLIHDERNRVPFISQRLKAVIDKTGVKGIQYHPVELFNDTLSLPYFIMFIPELDIFDKSPEEIDSRWDNQYDVTFDYNKYTPYYEDNIEIFRSNSVFCGVEIMVTENIKNAIELSGYNEGFLFSEIK